MDVSIHYADPVKEDFIGCKEWGQLWSSWKRSSSSVENLVAELGSALEDALVLLSTSAPAEEGCEVSSLEKDKECGESFNSKNVSLLEISETKFGEIATLQRSTLCCDEHLSGKDKLLDATLSVEENTSGSGSPTRTSLVSLPTSSKRVSAIKGSREKQGLHTEKLSVSWAPEVYDPPATSQSHTVKSHSQYYTSMNKKSHRQKNKNKHKAKSPRSSSSDKKQYRKIVRSS